MENPQKCNQRTSNRFTSLPIELHHDIFCLLPSKPLHKCKSVSKQWNSTISSQEFTHFHTLHSLSSPHSNRLLVLRYLNHLSSLELDNSVEPIISKHNNIILSEIRSIFSLRLVGTCNGLICIAEIRSSQLKSRLYVYNPFTRRTWTVPTLQESGYWLYGFGYDSATDDYKIMGIRRAHNSSTEALHKLNSIEAHVFSFRYWSWKQVDDFPYKLRRIVKLRSRPCVFVDKFLHWMAVLEDSNRHGSPGIGIVRFDLSREEYSLMELPQKFSFSAASGYVELELFEGCLSLQVMHDGLNGESKFDVWVMGEYNVSQSWRRLFQSEGYFRGSAYWMKVMAYSSNRDRVLVDRNFDHYWYDTEGNQLEHAGYVDISDNGKPANFFASIACAGTLVSPYCGKQ